MISCQDGRCTVEGPITMRNVTAVLEEGNKLFSAGEVTVDLSRVTEVDSSAVSLLLEWRREAKKANRRVAYSNLPENLKSLAELYGVSALLDGR